MASSFAGKHEWIVILPDKEGVLETRMKARPSHMENALKLGGTGFFTLGGAFLKEPIVEGEKPNIQGSVLIARADTKEEILEVLKKDIYTKEDVWDWDKVQMYPFKSLIGLGA